MNRFKIISIFSAVLASQVKRSERFYLHQFIVECLPIAVFQKHFVVKLKKSAVVQPSSGQNMYWRMSMWSSILMPMSMCITVPFLVQQVRSSSLMRQVKLKSIQSIWNLMKCCNIGTLLEGSVKLTSMWIFSGNFCTFKSAFGS